MKDFSKYYDFITDDDTKIEVRKIADKANYVSNNYTSIVTEFVNPYVLELTIPILNNYDINYELFPSYEFSERKSLVLFPQYLDDIDIGEFIIGLRINNKSKFKKLDHKDYLGSLMSLGIERDKIGDIYVFDDYADIIIHKDICDYITINLDKVGNNKVHVESIGLNDITYKEPDNIILTVNPSSLRLDNVVKSIINKPRDISYSLINSGDIKVNFIITQKNTYLVKEGDLISISKYGRYKVNRILGNTKSGKVKLEIKQYIKK